jgi:hypothetical protein
LRKKRQWYRRLPKTRVKSRKLKKQSLSNAKDE